MAAYDRIYYMSYFVEWCTALYTVRNSVLRRRSHIAVKLNFRPCILPYSSPYENFEHNYVLILKSFIFSCFRYQHMVSLHPECWKWHQHMYWIWIWLNQIGYWTTSSTPVFKVIPGKTPFLSNDVPSYLCKLWRREQEIAFYRSKSFSIKHILFGKDYLFLDG